MRILSQAFTDHDSRHIEHVITKALDKILLAQDNLSTNQPFLRPVDLDAKTLA